MRAHKANEFPIQTLWWQSIIIALNILRKVLLKMGRGWLLWLNAEGVSLMGEEGFFSCCLSLIGKCKAQGKQARCLARPILPSVKSLKGWRGAGRGRRSAQSILPQENWGLPPGLNRMLEEKFNCIQRTAVNIKNSLHTANRNSTKKRDESVDQKSHCL